MTQRWLKKLAFRLVTVALTLVFCALAAEAALRLLGVQPREYTPADVFQSAWWTDYPGPGDTVEYVGWVPFNVKEFDVWITFNSLGWRDNEYSIEKEDGVYRILAVGDSYVEGKEVPLEKTFHKLLESMLNEEFGRDVEVIALGRGGSSTGDYLRFIRTVGLKFAPDLVILSVFPGNDVVENSDELYDRYIGWLSDVYEPYVIEPRIAIFNRFLWIDGSYLNHFVVDRLIDIYTSNAHLFHADLTKRDLVSNGIGLYSRGPYEKAWEHAWEKTLREIRLARDLAGRHGAEFLLVIAHSGQIPGISPDELAAGQSTELDLRRPVRILVEFSERQGIEYVDLEPVLTEFMNRSGERYYWQYDAHWNEAGHRIVAEALFDRLTATIDPP